MLLLLQLVQNGQREGKPLALARLEEDIPILSQRAGHCYVLP